MPHLKDWQAKYSASGLVIIGVHTPEFDFEKDVANVQAALKKFGVAYPVVMDSDYEIWSLYSNSFWPNKFLINKDGQIVYNHAGEGNYKEAELAIQKALLEINPGLKLPEPTEEEGSGGICYPTTAETYLGSLRGRQGNVWRVRGDWKIFPEYIAHERKTADFEDCIVLDFEAAEVNLVAEAASGQPTKLRLGLNGKFLKELDIREARMYNLISGKEFIKGELKIFAKDESVKAYAFTFGGCVK